MSDCSCLVACVEPEPPAEVEPLPGERPAHQVQPSEHHLVTERLLNKLEKEQSTNVDVQIGTGMDIGIIGENGKS